MRLRGERALRLLGAGALTLALVQAILARYPRSGTRGVTPAELPGVLAADRSLDTIALVADTALDPVHRDWLAAVARSGRAVRWSGDSLPALAIAVEPLLDPAGGSRVLVAAPGTAALSIADALGALDSSSAGGGGASFTVGRLLGATRVGLAHHGASTLPSGMPFARRIMLFGRAAWETKFVLAALEERGWSVAARIPLAPDAAVAQDGRGRLDTATTAVVIALDSSAGREAAGIAAFVRQGGGLLLGPEAAADPAFAALRAGRQGTRRSAALLEPPAADPRRGLALSPIVANADALPLEWRDDAIAVAGRRVGAGRVIQLGYEESWRWRMTGPDGAVAAHRQWWSALVEAAAYRATVTADSGISSHDAPRARMVARFGPPDPPFASGLAQTPRQADGPAWWLCGLALAALLAEWALRRLRGAA